MLTDTEKHMRATLREMQLLDVEKERIDTDEKLKNRLLEMQEIYDRETAIREKAIREYMAHKVTMKSIIEQASFSRPTAYYDKVLMKFGNHLAKECVKNDETEKCRRAIADKQEVEQAFQAVTNELINQEYLQEQVHQLEAQVSLLKSELDEKESRAKKKSKLTIIDGSAKDEK